MMQTDHSRRTDRSRNPDRPQNAGGSSCDTPRLLAINDVRIVARPSHTQALLGFYGDLLGFEHLPAASSPERLTFRGARPTGPKLLVDLDESAAPEPHRRAALVQVRSIIDLAEIFRDEDIEHEWMHGLSYYDRRLVTVDPAGNRIELVTYHPF